MKCQFTNTVHLQQKESGLLIQKQGESRVTMTG